MDTVDSDDKSILLCALALIEASPAKPGQPAWSVLVFPFPSPPGSLRASDPLTRRPPPSSDLNPTSDGRILELVTETGNLGKVSGAWGLSPVLKKWLHSDFRGHLIRPHLLAKAFPKDLF